MDASPILAGTTQTRSTSGIGNRLTCQTAQTLSISSSIMIRPTRLALAMNATITTIRPSQTHLVGLELTTTRGAMSATTPTKKSKGVLLPV